MKHQITFTVSNWQEAKALTAAAHVITNDDGHDSNLPITATDYFALLFALHQFLRSDKNNSFRSADGQSLTDAITTCSQMVLLLRGHLLAQEGGQTP